MEVKRNEWFTVFGLAIIAFLISYNLYVSNASYWWDEAEYGLLGQSLLRSGQFTVVGDAYSPRNPLLPVLFALFTVFGVVQFLIPLFSGLSVAAIYLLAKKYYGTYAGIFAAILLQTSTLYFFYSGRMLTEIPSVFFTIVSVYYFKEFLDFPSYKKSAILAFIFSMSFLMSYKFFITVLAFMAYSIFRYKALIQYRDKILISAALFFIFISPVLFYSNAVFGTPTKTLEIIAFQFNDVQPTEWFVGIIGHIFSNWFVILLLLLSIGYGLLYSKPEFRYLSILVIITFVASSFLLAHKEDRYLIPILPMAFILIGSFCGRAVNYILLNWKNANLFVLQRLAGAIIVLIMLYFATIGNLPNAQGLYEYKRTSFDVVKTAGSFVKDHSGGSDLVFSNSPIALYYAERKFIKSLNQSNYGIVTLWDGLDNETSQYILDHQDTVIEVFPNSTAPQVLIINNTKLIR